MDDLAGARDADERDVVAGMILTMAAELRLGVAGSWQGKGKWMLRLLRECDPSVADQLLAAHRATVTIGDAAALVAMCERILALVGGRLTEGFVVR